MAKLLPLFVFFSSLFLANAESLKPGDRVDSIQLQDLKGAPAQIAPFKGNVTVVMFVSTQCPVSNAYNERMKAVYSDYAARGVKFVFVNSNANEPPDAVEDHAKATGFPFAVYKDLRNVVADRFGAQFTPETFVIDRDGVLRYHGAIDNSQNPARITVQGLRSALDEVLSGKPVTTAETRAFGCTIKRVPKTT
jgi:thiol-disulfide isomerase/thioredoxin